MHLHYHGLHLFAGVGGADGLGHFLFNGFLMYLFLVLFLFLWLLVASIDMLPLYSGAFAWRLIFRLCFAWLEITG